MTTTLSQKTLNDGTTIHLLKVRAKLFRILTESDAGSCWVEHNTLEEAQKSFDLTVRQSETWLTKAVA